MDTKAFSKNYATRTEANHATCTNAGWTFVLLGKFRQRKSSKSHGKWESLKHVQNKTFLD